MKTKQTSKCFLGSKYCYRDSDIDTWLPEKQEVKKPTTLNFKLFEDKTFLEIYGNNPETFSLTEIESLIENDSDKLIKDGYGNFFPVKSKDGVAVVHASRDGDRQWGVSVRRLGDDYRWGVGHRFFSRNGFLDTSVTSDTSLALRVASLESDMEKIKGWFNSFGK
jgi:hypothetical protein